MTWFTAISAVLGPIIGILLGWHLSRRSDSLRLEREHREHRRERGRFAALELIEVCEDAYEIFRNNPSYPDPYGGPKQSELYTTYRALRTRSQQIPDKAVRERLDKIATCFFNWNAAMQMGAGSPHQIAYQSREAALDTLGAFVRDEGLPDVAKLEEMHRDIESYYADLEAAEEEERARQAEERKQSKESGLQK